MASGKIEKVRLLVQIVKTNPITEEPLKKADWKKEYQERPHYHANLREVQQVHSEILGLLSQYCQ